MATQRHSLLTGEAIPDSTGNCWSQKSSILLVNALHPVNLFVFKTGVLGGFSGKISVPKDYVGTPKLVIKQAGKLDFVNASLWDFKYKSIAATEDGDPSTNDQTITGISNAASGAAFTIVETTSTTLSGTLAADDDFFFTFERDGASESPNNTDTLILFGAFLEYADA